MGHQTVAPVKHWLSGIYLVTFLKGGMLCGRLHVAQPTLQRRGFVQRGAPTQCEAFASDVNGDMRVP